MISVGKKTLDRGFEPDALYLGFNKHRNPSDCLLKYETHICKNV